MTEVALVAAVLFFIGVISGEDRMWTKMEKMQLRVIQKYLGLFGYYVKEKIDFWAPPSMSFT